MQHPHRPMTLALSLTLLPLAAQAHPGHESLGSLALGVMHPFTGWDHLTVLLCLGLIAAGRGLNRVLAAGILLASALMGGAALGMLFPQAAFVEPAVFATVIASPALLLLHGSIGQRHLAMLCLGFTLVHGMAHGQDAPAGNISAYFAGFTLAGLAIYMAGVLVAEGVIRRASGRRLRPVESRL